MNAFANLLDDSAWGLLAPPAVGSPPPAAVFEEPSLDEAILVGLPCLIKAHTDGNGRRIAEVEASCEVVDSDGDIILQKALLDSADSFVSNGHIDIDHKSEFGTRLGIRDPSSYIIGRPLEVKDMGKTRTSVVFEVRKNLSGQSNPTQFKYDEFWESLQTDPPVKWLSSVYGFPKRGEIINCKTNICPGGATRFFVKGFDWRSLAMTRNPKNGGLNGYAKIATAKSFILELLKGSGGLPLEIGEQNLTLDRNTNWHARNATKEAGAKSIDNSQPNIHDLWTQRTCPCGVGEIQSVPTWTDHFVKCAGMDAPSAEIASHAMMYRNLLAKMGF